jgi:hypothetical protein
LIKNIHLQVVCPLIPPPIKGPRVTENVKMPATSEV